MVNNLTSTSATDMLSANQGRVLNNSKAGKGDVNNFSVTQIFAKPDSSPSDG